MIKMWMIEVNQTDLCDPFSANLTLFSHSTSRIRAKSFKKRSRLKSFRCEIWFAWGNLFQLDTAKNGKQRNTMNCHPVLQGWQP